MEQIRKFFRNESGATAVEYALIVALLAAVIVGAVTALRDNLTNAFDNVGEIIGDPDAALDEE